MLNVYFDLWQCYQVIKVVSIVKYVCDIVVEMGISEVELIVVCFGYDVVCLSDDVWVLIVVLECVGEIKCICCNEYVVYEQVGQFMYYYFSGYVGLVLNLCVFDLCLFFSQWVSVFYLNDNGCQSIQFFDYYGDVLLKVYVIMQIDMVVWEILIVEYWVVVLVLLILCLLELVKYVDIVDGVVLENDWCVMIDVYQFFGLLCKYQFFCQQVFCLVSDDFVCCVDCYVLLLLLEMVCQEGNEIMIFVGNCGCVQIFIGVLEKLVFMCGWLNIFNIIFILYLCEESVDEVWVICKLILDGYVISVELFVKDGIQIVQFYGQCSEGYFEQM